MRDLDPKNKQLVQRVENMKQQIAQLNESNQSGESTTFKMPSSDKQAILMLKLVKRLRDTVRNEHNKGRLDTQTYVTENARLETMQIRINIENVIKRANDSIARGQPGTALQLLRKGIDALSTKMMLIQFKQNKSLKKCLVILIRNARTRTTQKCSKLPIKSVTAIWMCSSVKRKVVNSPQAFRPIRLKAAFAAFFVSYYSENDTGWITQI